MSSAARRHTGSLEHALQWALGLLVVTVLLSLTGVAFWIGREGTEQFVASRLAHDAEALIAGFDPQSGKVDRPLPPVYGQPFSGHYYWVLFNNGQVVRSRSWWDYPFEAAALASGETALQTKTGPREQRLLLWRSGYENLPYRLSTAARRYSLRSQRRRGNDGSLSDAPEEPHGVRALFRDRRTLRRVPL